jgi:predicted membrane channel-forming protein YqfA (hemolysin III family)
MLFKRGAHTVKWMVIGVVVLLPSAFVFLLKLNIHRWLNKDDLSHLFMLGAIICFYLAMRGWKLNTTKEVNV